MECSAKKTKKEQKKDEKKGMFSTSQVYPFTHPLLYPNTQERAEMNVYFDQKARLVVFQRRETIIRNEHQRQGKNKMDKEEDRSKVRRGRGGRVHTRCKGGMQVYRWR